MWKIILFLIIVLIVVIAGALIFGANRWQRITNDLHTRMESVREFSNVTVYDPAELEGLPAPVQRYFQIALTEGQPIIKSVRIKHSGTFNMGQETADWKPFHSEQYVITGRPGFVWDARVSMAPGMDIRVHDAYAAGEGILHARLFGLIQVMEVPASPELDHGELMRYFAEAVWYPTALLPSQGVAWEAIDDTHAAATLTDGGTTVKLVFTFNKDGLPDTAYSDGRGHTITNGEWSFYPWEARLLNYTLHDKMMIPDDGEVVWLLPEGEKPYWRGHIEEIEFNFAQ